MLLNGVDGDAQLICNLFMRELGFTTHLKNLTLAGSQLLQGMGNEGFQIIQHNFTFGIFRVVQCLRKNTLL